MQPEGYEVTYEFEETHWWYVARRKLIFAQVKKAAETLGEGLEILDFGCGTGYNLRHLARFGHVTGADILTAEHDSFQRRDGHQYIDLKDNLDGQSGRYALITALDVIEHIDDDIAALRSIRDMLRDEGQLIITVPAYDWLWSGEDIISEHKRRYTQTQLRQAFLEAGFSEVYCSYFNVCILPILAVVIWAKKLLAPGRSRQSDLKRSPALINSIMSALVGLEDVLVGREKIRLPAGASIVCRLRKMGQGESRRNP